MDFFKMHESMYYIGEMELPVYIIIVLKFYGSIMYAC